MTQAVILEQCTLYLRTRWREEVAAIEAAASPHITPDEQNGLREMMRTRAEYINQLEKQFLEGECFGLAICHGAMALLGKQDWWEDALLHIYKWNGHPEKLDEEINLKNGREPTTLRKLFELAISYVVHSHSAVYDEITGFFPGDVTQLNALKKAVSVPTLAHVQILKDDGTLLTVQKNETVAGHFSKEQMRLLLDEETFAGNICLVHTMGHTARISYVGNDKWQFYNPSAAKSTREKGTLHFIGTKDQVIDAIYASMRCQDLAIEVAAVYKDSKINLSAYLDMVVQEPASLLTNDSILLMTLETPQTLKDIFELAKKPEYKAKLLPHLANIISEGRYQDEQNILHIILIVAPQILPALFELMDQSAEGKLLRSVIAKKLIEKETEFHQTPLHQLASFSTDGFITLLQVAISDPHNDELIHAISQTILMRLQKSDDTLLDFLTKSPTAYRELLKLATQPHAVPIRIALVKSLSEKMNNGMPRIVNNISLAPAMLPFLLAFINQYPEAKTLQSLFSTTNPDLGALRLEVSKALPVRFNDSNNVMHIIAKFSPELVMNLLRFILSDHDQASNLGYVMTALAGDSEGVTGWHMITDTLPKEQQKAFVAMLTDRLEYLTTPELIIFAQELNRALTDQQSRFRGLCSMSHNLFKSQHYGKSEIWQSLLGKSREILVARNEAVTPEAQEIMKIKIN